MKQYTQDQRVTVNGAFDGQKQKATVIRQDGNRVAIRYDNTGIEADVAVTRVRALEMAQ